MPVSCCTTEPAAMLNKEKMVKYLSIAAFGSLAFRSEAIPRHAFSEKSTGCHGTSCPDNSFLSSAFDRNGTHPALLCSCSQSSALSDCHHAALPSLALGRGCPSAGSGSTSACFQDSRPAPRSDKLAAAVAPGLTSDFTGGWPQGSPTAPKWHLLSPQKVLCIFLLYLGGQGQLGMYLLVLQL